MKKFFAILAFFFLLASNTFAFTIDEFVYEKTSATDLFFGVTFSSVSSANSFLVTALDSGSSPIDLTCIEVISDPVVSYFSYSFTPDTYTFDDVTSYTTSDCTGSVLESEPFSGTFETSSSLSTDYDFAKNSTEYYFAMLATGLIFSVLMVFLFSNYR